MDILLIRDGTVANCICADSPERALQFYPDHLAIERTGAHAQAGPGWLWDGEHLTPPPDPPPAPPDPPAPISRLEFLRRIPAAARIAIRQAAATDPVLADALQLLDLAESVRLDDPDTVILVGYLRQQGHLTDAQAAVVMGV